MSADLHIYAQGAWHDSAYIVGTREGLHALRDAVNDALEMEGQSRSATVFTSDGEGFHVHVIRETEDGMLRYVLPYTDAMAKDADTESPSWPRKRGA